MIDADVVVVGTGIAGLSATVTAAEEGAKVVLLEKMGSVGGASLVCGGEILAAGTQMQKDQGIEDSSESLRDYWIEVGQGNVNEANGELFFKQYPSSGSSIQTSATMGRQAGKAAALSATK